MPQFMVYRNTNPKSKAALPYLVDIQNDLLSDLHTRVVIPLFLRRGMNIKPITVLTPEFEVEGKKVVLLTPQLAGISSQELRSPVASLSQKRTEITAALDLLVTGF